jgi:hypothetical protein
MWLWGSFFTLLPKSLFHVFSLLWLFIFIIHLGYCETGTSLLWKKHRFNAGGRRHLPF